MRRHTSRAAALLLCLAPAAVAFRPSAINLSIEKGSRIWVGGTSTVRSFSCEAPEFTASIEGDKAGAATQILVGEKSIKSATLIVAADKMNCGNGTMNEHMAKALKSKDFPTITFVLGAYEPKKVGAGAAGTIDGQLTLGGITKPITVNATAKDENGALRVSGVYDLDMTAYGLKPPSLMMGTMKVGKIVKVNFDLVVKG